MLWAILCHDLGLNHYLTGNFPWPNILQLSISDTINQNSLEAVLIAGQEKSVLKNHRPWIKMKSVRISKSNNRNNKRGILEWSAGKTLSFFQIRWDIFWFQI